MYHGGAVLIQSVEPHQSPIGFFTQRIVMKVIHQKKLILVSFHHPAEELSEAVLQNCFCPIFRPYDCPTTLILLTHLGN
jgi:hypothetical protein